MVALGALVLCFAVDRPVVPTVKNQIQPLWQERVPDALSKTMTQLAKGGTLVTNYRLPVRLRANADPWGAMGELELIGRGVAEDAAGLAPVQTVLGRMERALKGQSKTSRILLTLSYKTTLQSEMKVLKQAITLADQMRSNALHNLTPDERKAVFARGAEIVKEFSPQEELTNGNEAMLKADRAFVEDAWTKIDWDEMVAAAGVLSSLVERSPASPRRVSPPVIGSLMADLAKTCAKAKSHDSRVPGVSGKLMYEEKLPQGWLIVSGPGPHTFDMREPAAMIVDLGGGNTYKGTAAASFDADHGNSVVIDMGGRNTYECEPLGLAAGRLGCGMLFDLEGDNTYALQTGREAWGSAGSGSWSNQGRATIAKAPNTPSDARSRGWAWCSTKRARIPTLPTCTVSAWADRAGSAQSSIWAEKNTYRCGFDVPSGYNQTDAPNGKPGDPNFQYEAWGMGIGMGRRLYPFVADGYRDYTMAGGIGMLIDVKGGDTYESSNFSLGCGYFFGVGLCMNFAGHNHYSAARYGLASGAHYAMGLCIDYGGYDVFDSTGPTYDCGCSWDHSAFLFIAAGGNDVYNLKRSSGPGRADIGSWGVAADLGANNVYHLTSYPASNSQDGLSGFLDFSGSDVYDFPMDPKIGVLGDHRALVVPPGGVVFDR